MVGNRESSEVAGSLVRTQTTSTQQPFSKGDIHEGSHTWSGVIFQLAGVEPPGDDTDDSTADEPRIQTNRNERELRLKICLDIRSQSGAGLTVIIENLVREILRIGAEHEFALLCHANQKPPDADVEIWNLPAMSRWRELIWVQTRLPGLLRENRIDLYHSLKHLGPLRCPCRSILSLNEIGQYLGPRDLPLFEYAYWTYFEPISLKRADHVIAISEWCREVAVKKIGVDPSKLTVVPCGLGLAFTHKPDPGAGKALRDRLALPDRYLLAVGTITPKKNYETVVRSLAKLREARSESIDLVIAGGTGYRVDQLGRLIEELGLKQQIHFTGFLSMDELVHLYHGALALVYPSVYESFGIPPIEAMACGIPVVTTRRGAIPEVTGDFAWYLEDPTDAAGLADLISEALRDSPEKKERLQRAQGWVQRYSWSAAAESILKLYRESTR